MTIANSTGFNDALQPFTYGTTISFELTISLSATSSAGTTFSFYFLDSNFGGYSTGPSGEALDITVYSPSNVATSIYGPTTGGTTPSVTVSSAVPEPSGVVLLGVGVAATAAWGRRRARRRTA